MRPWATAILLLAVACAPPSLPEPPRAPTDAEPFRVLSISARGLLDAPPEELTVTFTRAMHPIESPATDASSIGRLERATDHAPVAGSWAWFGSRTAVFRPKDGPLPGATSFLLTIPQGTVSLDGSRLPAAETAEFSTPRPRLRYAQFELDESVPGQPRPHVNLTFNMPVRASEVERAVHLEGKLHGVPFRAPIRVEPPEHDTADSFLTRPDPALVSVEDLAAIAEVGLSSPEGPLAAEDMTRIEVGGPGPVTITVNCADRDGTCDPDAYVWLSLSKSTRSADLVAHLDPRPKTKHPLADLEEQVSSLDLAPLYPLPPRGKLKVTVRAGLVMNDGDTLEKDRTVEIVMGDRKPMLRWDRLGENTVIEAARPTLDFGLTSVNVPSFELAYASIDERELYDFLSKKHDSPRWIREVKGSVTREIKPGAALNADARLRAGIPAALRSKSGLGHFLVGIAAPHGDGDLGDGPNVLSVTDLGLTTKWGPYGGLVWVTHLSSGAPVAGASVSVTPLTGAGGSPTPAFAATTDADGVVNLPRELATTLGSASGMLVARAGADWSYARLSPPRAVQPLGVVFTERRLYRPGETVYAKGYFRIPGTHGTLESPVGRLVDVVLRMERGMVHTERVALDAFGAFSLPIKLPPSKVGWAGLEVQLLGPNGAPPLYGSASTSFSVADYRTVEMKVEVRADRSTYVRDDLARLAISARYLFGAPMHDVPVHYSFRRAPFGFTPPGLDGFSFGDDLFGRTPSADPTGTGSAVVGADGRAEPSLKLDLPDQRGTERVDVEAGVDDVGKAFTVIGRATGLVVHPGTFLLGVRVPGEPAVFAGDRLRVETVAADPAGVRQPGVPIHLALHRLVGNDRRVVAECDAKAGEPLARECAFVTTDPGSYSVLATGSDTRGHSLFASAEIYVPKRSKQAEPKAAPDAQAHPLSFDRRCAKARGGSTSIDVENKTYAPGDSARVCVATRAPRALLTMEREGVLHHELLSLVPGAPGGDAGRSLAKGPLAIPITADLEPDARVAVHAVTGRRGPVTLREEGSARPLATSADTAISVARPDKRLEVTITPRAGHAANGPVRGPTPFQPGDEVDVDLAVASGRGKPARVQVTFFAVDQGVNELAPFRPPSPEVFWQARGDKVVTTDSRDRLYWEPLRGAGHVSRAPSIRAGSTSVDGDFRGAGRKSFQPTAVFRPAILTGADGRATVHFKLPDNTTTWKLFAVAADDADGFGTAEGQLVTSQWFTARSALPRFLRAGDRAVAGVVVDSAAPENASVDVSFSATGAATGRGVIPLQLKGLDHVPLGFDVVAQRPGRATVDFSLVGHQLGHPGVNDAVQLGLPVREPWTLETVAFAGETGRARPEATEAISVLGRRPDAGWLEYRVAATPLVALGEGMDQLLEYPYGCTEQLVSRLVPLVALRGLAARYGLTLPADAESKAREAVTAILSHQRGDNGIGAWEQSASNPWLTSYALWGLSVAKDAGLDVPAAPVERAFAYLDAEHKTATAEDLAFAEDVRASHDHARPEHLEALLGRTSLSVEARALLAHAEAKLDPARARSLLDAIPLRASGAIATVAPGEGERSFPGSTAQATALVLRAFTAVDPKNALVPALARGLLSLRQGGRWATTQDAAWALLALADVGAEADASARDFIVRLGGRVVDHTHLPESSLVAHTGLLPMSTLAGAGTLSFQSTSGAPLFYEAYLRSAPTEAPTSALAHGLQIDRTYRVIGGDGAPQIGPIHVGDYVLVDVYVASAAPRVQVVLDDPLPAGLEPVSGAFATEARGTVLQESNFNHREYRDDRVVTFMDKLGPETRHFMYRAHATTAGVFHTPAARAECMYAPDVFGRTDAPVVTISAPRY